MVRQVIQSFKKVLNNAETTQPITAVTKQLVLGEDSIAAGQTGPTDPGVPTGSVIKFILIQYSCMNLVNVSNTHHWCIQLLHSGQTIVPPDAVGGNPQRNQVFVQGHMNMGQSQNNNRTIKFKIPRKFQRVREGDSWNFTSKSTQVYTDAMQTIYKFYR